MRHPFRRLESAYRSKFVNFNAYFRRKYGAEILRRYRQSNKDVLGSKNPRLVARQTLNRNQTVNVSRNASSEPLWMTSRVTFDEFIRYIIDRDLRAVNRHWDNYEQVAHPCTFAFS